MPILPKQLLTLLLPCLLCASALSQTCGPYTANPQKSIQDFGLLQDTLLLSFGPNEVITNLAVGLNLTHDFVSDLDIQLVSPSGLTVPLMLNRCGEARELDLIFTDTAAPLQCQNTITGTASPPDGMLSQFNNELTDGLWILRITDEFIGDEGVLDSWCLIPETQTITCQAPVLQPVSGITPNSAVISWTDSNAPPASEWELELVKAGDLPTGIPDVMTTDNPYTLSGLEPATTYFVLLRARCGAVTGAWSNPLSFTTYLPNPTPCGIVVPIPDNACGPGNEFRIQVNSAPGSQLGQDVQLSGLRLIIDHPWMADLEISLTSPSGATVQLSSDNGGSGNNFGLPDDTSCTGYTFISSTDCNATSIQDGAAPFLGVFLPEEDMQTLHDGGSPLGLWTLTICDDAGDDTGSLRYAELVFEGQQCPAPRHLELLQVGADFAELDWLPSGNCQAVIIEYGPPGFTPGSGAAAGDPQSTLLSLPCPLTLPYTLSGLQELTAYDLYIREQCGPTAFSANTCLVSFETDCSTGAVSLTENIDAQSACGTSCFDACSLSGTWTNADTDDIDWLVNSGPTATPLTGPDADVSGSGNYLYLETSSPCVDGVEAVLQSNCLAVDASGGNCHFSFFYHLSGNDIATLRLEATTNGGLNWLPLWSLSGDQGEAWVKQYIDLSIFDQDTVQLRFVGSKGGGSYGDMALDELTFYGSQDLGAPDRVYFLDADADGFGRATDSIVTCRSNPPAGYAANALDCDDDDPDIFPGADEIPCNSLDDNCNGPADDLDLPAPATTGDTICAGETATLAVTQSFSGESYWYLSLTDTLPFAEGDSVTVAPMTDQTYYVQDSVSAQGCRSPRQPVFVKVNPQPILAGADTVLLCEDAPVNLSALPLGDQAASGAALTWHTTLPASPGNQLPDPWHPAADAMIYALAVAPGGCTDRDSLFVQLRPTPSLSLLPADTLLLCSGEPALLESETTYNGPDSLQYLWDQGFTEPQLAILGSASPGEETVYTLTVSNAAGCSDSDSIRVITADALSAVSLGAVQEVSTCGAADGQISLQPLNGQAPYTLQWEGPVSGNVSSSGALLADNLAQGAYRLTVTDASGADCPFIIPLVTVGGPELDVQEVKVQDVSCRGEADGGLALLIASGDPDINWSTGETSTAITGLAAGFYSVTVSDVGCLLVFDSLLVEEPDSLRLTNLLASPVTCAGAADGEIQLQAEGGELPYTVTWADGPNGAQRSNLSGGLYSFTLTDANGCSLSESINIEEPAPLAFSLDSIRPVSCFEGQDGSLLVSASGGRSPYLFNWDHGATGPQLDSLAAGFYLFTLTDNSGCSLNSGPLLVSQPQPLQINIDSLRPASCNASLDAYLALSAQGGTPGYQWLWNTADTGAVLDPILAGVYSVTLTDANGCIAREDSIPVAGPQLLTVSPSILEQPTCLGADNGRIELAPAGGSGPYTFQWSTGDTTALLDSLPAGSYQCTLTDANGCSLISPFYELTQDQILQVEVDLEKDISCFGKNDGSIFLSVSGGVGPYAFVWNDGDTSEDRQQLTSVKYQVTITDQQGCERIFGPIDITEPDSLSVEVVNVEDVVCSGQENGSIDIQAIGGTPPYDFSWNNTAETEDLNGLPIGFYKVTAVDQNGCAFTSPSIPVSEPPPLEGEVLSSQQPDCDGSDGGSADVGISGGIPPYNFAWSNGSTDEDLDNVSAGTYAVTVTDANNCLLILPVVEVLEPVDSLFVLIDSVQGLNCFGDQDGFLSAQVVGGQGPYQFLWSTGNDSSLTLQEVGSGNYTISVTDENGCEAISQTVNLPNPDPLLALIDSVRQPSCYGELDGAIYLSVSGAGGYHFTWRDGQGNAISDAEDITGLGPGQYFCEVTDTNGCQVNSVTKALQWADSLQLQILSVQASCPGGASGQIAVTAQGGKPAYQYDWSNGESGAELDGLPAGSYVLTITDQAGCSLVSDSLQIDSLPGEPLEVLLLEQVDVACKNGTDGSLSIAVEGGLPPYDILWINGKSGGQIEQLPAGGYQATITDGQGCTLQTPVYQLTEPDTALEVFVLAISGNLCAPDTFGSIEVEAMGGIPPYDIMWSNGDSSAFIDGLAEGYYTLSLTDANQCELIPAAYYVSAPPPFQLAVSSAPATGQSADGSATVTVIGGTPPYDFLWDAAAGSQDSSTATGLAAGPYSVTITDANGCDTVAAVEVEFVSAVGNAQLLQALYLYPNPTSGRFRIDYRGGIYRKVQVRLLDAMGREMVSFQRELVPYEPWRMDISDLSAGLYFLEIRDRKGALWTERIILSR